MKVKVRTERLIELIQERKRRELTEYEAARQAYPTELAGYVDKVGAALSKALARCYDRGIVPPSYGRWTRDREVAGVIVDVGAMPPPKPRRPDHKRANARLRELRLETREDLLVDIHEREWSGLL